MGTKFWEVLFKLLPQVMATAAAVESRGGHGSFEIDLTVKDKATGQDIIENSEVAEVTF